MRVSRDCLGSEIHARVLIHSRFIHAGLIFGIAGSFRIASLAKRVGCARENPAKLQFFDSVLTQTCQLSSAAHAN